RTGWRDVVGCHRVPYLDEHSCALDGGYRAGIVRHVDEERRLLDVGRLRVSVEELPALDRDRVPGLVRAFDAVVHAPESLGVHGRLEVRGDLVVSGPQILEIDRGTGGVGRQRVVDDV